MCDVSDQNAITVQGRSNISKIGSVHLSFQPHKRPYNGQRRRGRGMAGGVPPQPTRESEGRRELSQRGRKRFWGVSCAILCDFTHLLMHLTAARKREISTPLYWLVGLIFPCNIFGVSDTST